MIPRPARTRPNDRGRGCKEAALSDGTPLGALLIAEGLLTEAQLDAALAEQARGGKPLGRLLIESGTISEADLVRTLAQQVGLDFIDLNDHLLDASIAALVSESLARRYQAIPIAWEDGRLVVAMADPSNVFAIDDIRAIAGVEIKTVVATATQISESLERLYRMDSDVDAVVAAAADEHDDDADIGAINQVVEDAPIVKFVNLLINQAVNDRASDIHVEPTETDLRIRFRIDGVLHEVMRSPRSIQAGVISRLKVMAEINIAERRIPQDGRIGMKIGGRAIDLRVATLPIVYGEKVVMRILDKSQALMRLEDLGFLPETLDRFQTSYRKPYGAILVTGPTGSGKSTTLYAALNTINHPDRNIITVEDPVEYRLAGINQVQVNPKAGLTFASALRSILRADPDIILVGEIRDRETSIIAIEAALTGHLVLSTLHTNDAASTPLRMVEMGVEPFLVTSALDCVVAQRLARRLCEKCKEAYQPSEAELPLAGWPMEQLNGGDWPTLFRASGCSACGRTGYRGRFALHEVMLVSEEIERQIIERRSTEDIQKTAIMEGMLSLKSDGLRKVARGDTSLEEIFRVVA
ncbi:MAG: type secretory pathway, ATPase PulE/Tfp pilus assembly pathway, ATPase PilB [Actinomycetia bacterium]|nr:type secretory pathway, ATPase PulE/Tfp pilus assembly pathway, ATPase PilB [Actinomycetes bacterium]